MEGTGGGRRRLIGAAAAVGLAASIVTLPLTAIPSSAATGDINAVAGSPAAGPATAVPQKPGWLAMAGSSLLVSDGVIGTIRSINLAGGMETSVAGNGCVGHGGDGAAAATATIAPTGVAVGPDGSVYVAESAWNDVRRIDPSGTITTFAGKPSNIGAYSGDGGPATQAALNQPTGVAVAPDGTVYIADRMNYVVRRVDTSGTISTYAGTGSSFGSSPDGVPATQATLAALEGLATDPAGNLYLADATGIREVSNGIISTVDATHGFDTGVAWANGAVYFTDPNREQAFGVTGGVTSVIAGNGTQGYSGDGGPATAAELSSPVGIAADASGNVYIGDAGNYRLRVVTAGTIRTVAGTGSIRAADGGHAASTQISQVAKVALDGQGGYYFSEEFTQVVRHVDASGTLTTAAGNGSEGFSGDGGPATQAQLNNPVGLAVAANGDLYIADQSNARVRRVHSGVIDTVAGGGTPSGNGDGGPATLARLAHPQYLAFDHQGNLYISDDTLIRKVDSSGVITTYAGSSSGPDPGDGNLATNAYITGAAGIAFDGQDNLYIAETSYRSVVRRVDRATQIITTVAGKTNAPGYGGDGGPAASAYLAYPQDVQLDANGDLIIADTGNSRIRVVIDGQIYTAFGNGVDGCGGDGGPASRAEIGYPQGITLDSSGNLYTSQLQKVRLVSNAVTAIQAIGPRPTPIGTYHTMAPTRILDTRDGTGHPGRLGPGQSFSLPVAGNHGVPSSGVTAVVMNVTVTDTTQASYLTVFPSGAQRPVASNLNWTAGVTVPNLVEVPVGANGSVSFFNAAGYTDVVADLEGYVSTQNTAAGALLFAPTPPNRVIDTRNAGQHPLGPGQTMTVFVAAVPEKQDAVAMNVTVTDATAASYLTVWPHGQPRPTASNLNFKAGQTIANRVMTGVDLNTDQYQGSIDIYNAAGSVDVIVDVNGPFIEASAWNSGYFQGIPPVRILDTRDGTGGVRNPLGPGSTLSVPVAGRNGFPTGVQAIVGNITVTDTTAASYLTAWPANVSRPTASDINWVAGETVPNLAVVQLSSDGRLDLYNAVGTTDVIIDVTGWYR